MSVLKLVVGGLGCLFLGLGLGDVWQAVGALWGATRALQTLCNTCCDTLTLRQLIKLGLSLGNGYMHGEAREQAPQKLSG